MIILQAAFLGFLQTVTEIFPLSSKAHILLLQNLFGYKKSYHAYDVMMDCGILLALFIYFAKDIVRMGREMPVMLRWPFDKNRESLYLEFPYAMLTTYFMVSSLITAFVRFTFEDAGESMARFPVAVGFGWFLMGIMLFASRRIPNGPRNIYEMNHQDAFVIGLVQGLTVFPGVSRLGITLLTAMVLGIGRRDAARYAYLLGIPYIFSAIVYKFNLGPRFFDSDQTGLFVSFFVSAAVGILALAVSMRIIQRGLLFLAGFYCVAFGIFTIFQALIKVAFF
jgi:undecaprenyl-diphosphatase